MSRCVATYTGRTSDGVTWWRPLLPHRQIATKNAENHLKTAQFALAKLAPRLLHRRVSGGYSGPASRSGVPLEHPPFHILPAWLQGEVERHSLPRHVQSLTLSFE